MASKKARPRVLIYSHDSFGLGHLRRCRAIAHAMVGAVDDLTVLILSGSPIIGSFDFRARVDFVRVPGVIKLRNGEYTSLNLLLDTDQTMAMRESIMKHTADIFDPDILLVDKEPLGLRGEMRETIEMLKERGTRIILGLRDVMDDPDLLKAEWRRKKAMPALRDLYDDIWVYGLPQVHDPLEELDVPQSVRRKMVYTGYLERSVPQNLHDDGLPDGIEEPFVLVTTGGGGDGDLLVDWVLNAYECKRAPTIPALIVFGPFMQPEAKTVFQERVDQLDHVTAITFNAHLETLMARASGVVAMGGYNTFCEILSFDKPALIVPRQVPRKEQLIRASRAQELGLVSMLTEDMAEKPEAMATAIRQLTQQRRPSQVVVPGLLDGLENVNRLVAMHLAEGRTASKLRPETRQNLLTVAGDNGTRTTAR
ncbi:MAG: glycosyltransferase family protein [Alphaproteobacteria bacterium]|jgi:predicted glycosyltransferase